MSGEQREAGWYPDRNDPESNRYWNGRAWTARRLPIGVTPPPPVQEGAPHQEKPATGRAATGRAAAEAAKPKQRIPVWMWIVGGLMVARSIAGVMAAFDGSDAGHATVATHPVPHSSVSAPQTPHS